MIKFLIQLCIIMLCQPFYANGNTYPTDQRAKRFLLITGCGRSGTQFMYEYLKASGLEVGHEHMKDHGLVSWLMTSNASWSPWGPIPDQYSFEYIFHQVRHPLKVIESYYNIPPLATWEWVSLTIPEIKQEDPDIVKCAKYWFYWNILSESKAEWTYRIEDFDTAYKEMGQRVGLDLSKEVLDMIPKTTNTKVKTTDKKITWSLLKQELPENLFEKVVWLANKYGYSTSDPS